MQLFIITVADWMYSKLIDVTHTSSPELPLSAGDAQHSVDGRVAAVADSSLDYARLFRDTFLQSTGGEQLGEGNAGATHGSENTAGGATWKAQQDWVVSVEAQDPVERRWDPEIVHTAVGPSALNVDFETDQRGDYGFR